MIKAAVNGKIYEFEKKDYANFGEFFEEKKIQGMVLSKVVVNGNEISVSKIDELLKATFEGNEDIMLEFEDMIPFTLNLIDELFGFLDGFKKALPGFAGSLMIGNEKAIGGLTDFQSGIKSLETMKDNLYSLTGMDDGDTPGMVEKHKGIVEALDRMNQALQKKDWLELSDLIEYEFIEKLDYYDEVFMKAKEILNSRRS